MCIKFVKELGFYLWISFWTGNTFLLITNSFNSMGAYKLTVESSLEIHIIISLPYDSLKIKRYKSLVPLCPLTEVRVRMCSCIIHDIYSSVYPRPLHMVAYTEV